MGNPTKPNNYNEQSRRVCHTYVYVWCIFAYPFIVVCSPYNAPSFSHTYRPGGKKSPSGRTSWVIGDRNEGTTGFFPGFIVVDFGNCSNVWTSPIGSKPKLIVRRIVSQWTTEHSRSKGRMCSKWFSGEFPHGPHNAHVLYIANVNGPACICIFCIYSNLFHTEQSDYERLRCCFKPNDMKTFFFSLHTRESHTHTHTNQLTHQFSKNTYEVTHELEPEIHGWERKREGGGVERASEREKKRENRDSRERDSERER